MVIVKVQSSLVTYSSRAQLITRTQVNKLVAHIFFNTYYFGKIISEDLKLSSVFEERREFAGSG